MHNPVYRGPGHDHRAWFAAAPVLLAWSAFLVVGCESGPKNPWIGLNTQLGEPTLTPIHLTPDAAAPVCPELVRELNVPLIRDVAMNWATIQPHPDQPLDFTMSDQIVRMAQSSKADLLVVFKGVPGWASSVGSGTAVHKGLPAPEHEQAFVAFVRRFVQRYDHDGRGDMRGLKAPVRAYQFMYEMEDIAPSEYACWLKRFYQAVKATDPKATVVLGGLTSPGLKFPDDPYGDYASYFERLLDEPELRGQAYPFFDVAAFHSFPSRYPGRPPFDEPVGYMRQAMADRRLELPIWLTAYGMGSAPETLSVQADNIIKWTVKARSIGIQRLYLHCLCDCRDPGHGAVSNCGLVRESGDGGVLRKPAFHAFEKLVREIKDRPDVAFRGEGYYVLSGKDKPRYVVWREDSYGPRGTLSAGWWSVETLTGPKSVRQGSEVQLTASPLWVERTASPFIR